MNHECENLSLTHPSQADDKELSAVTGMMRSSTVPAKRRAKMPKKTNKEKHDPTIEPEPVKRQKDELGSLEATRQALIEEEKRKRHAAEFSSSENAEGHDFDYSYTQNREVSWLRFDDRVLEEAFDENVPLFERLKFVSIFQSNLDEWFMIRVGGLTDLSQLKHQPVDNKSHETPSEQLAVIFKTLPPHIRREETAFRDLERQLSQRGLVRVTPATLTDADRAVISRHFDQDLAPILSPLIIDPRHPFPNLRNGMQYVVCSLDGPEESDVLGMIEVPPTVGRVVPLASTPEMFRYILVEDVIISMLGSCFGSYTPSSSSVIRVTRNADIDPDGEGVEEEEDYRQHMKKVLKRRLRLQPVRLEIEGDLEKSLVSFVRKELNLSAERVFRLDMPLDLSYVYGLESQIPEVYQAELLFDPFEPQPSPMVDPNLPMRSQVEDHDILLFYPYESMSPLLDLIREASADEDCISIKITLYRVAKQSHLCESLIAASENGKDVTVLMELRARFDEENNIEWAERLESAGCTVIYGSEGFKCHSKICQITYHDKTGIRRITCLGTGNFNEKTARLYSDFMLITSHEGIGEDGNAFFRNLSLGNLRGNYKYLGVAPAGLKPLIMRGLDREIARAQAGEPAQVFMKMNSLTDRDVIDKLAEATRSGVKVLMVIRGICCIRADIPNKTDGLSVHQIVGRLLEHSRVYAFGADIDTVYLSSADMMTRNTERRVEIAYPVLDPTCRDLVIRCMNLQLADNVKARRLTGEGSWVRLPLAFDERRIDCQETLISLAYERAGNDRACKATATEPASKVFASAPQVLHVADEVLKAESQSPEKPHATHDDVSETREPSPATSDMTPVAQASHDRAPEEKPVLEDVASHVAEPEHGHDHETNAAPAPRIGTTPPAEQEEGAQATNDDVVKTPAASASSAPTSRGRFVTAFALIGAGFKTLFTGTGKSGSSR